jgi:hypothetical protein
MSVTREALLISGRKNAAASEKNNLPIGANLQTVKQSTPALLFILRRGIFSAAKSFSLPATTKGVLQWQMTLLI